MRRSQLALIGSSFCLLVLTGCITNTPYDYSAFNLSKPRSILVLPPVNNSIEVNAPYSYLSTITQPLAEKGYYVFPVAVIDNFLKENGLPTPEEMNGIPLDKIREHIGADAVLYVTIDNWGQKYEILSSSTVVSAQLRLVDARNGALLWETKVYAKQSSDSGGNGLLGAVVSAVVEQVAGSLVDRTPPVARAANNASIYNRSNGLPNGPYKPEVVAD